MNLATRFGVIVATATLLALPVSGQGGQPDRRTHEQDRRPAGPDLKVGQLAPTFELKGHEGDDTFALREFRGKRPVIIFFGSYS